MRQHRFPLVAAAVFAVAGFAADKPVKFADLPAGVQKTMLKETEATGAKIKNTLVEVEDGKTYYECESILANGKTRDFLVDPRGNVAEVEDEVEAGEVPAAVKAAVEKAAAGGGRITKLEAVKKNGKVTGYEASITKNGKKTGLALHPDGTRAK